MARKEYAPETKAAVMAALLEGQAVSHVAEKYNIPAATVSGWKSKAKESLGADLPNEKREAIGELLLEYLRENLETLREQARHFRDPAWLKEQGAAESATLHGVMTDKAVRLLEAMSPAADADAPAG